MGPGRLRSAVLAVWFVYLAIFMGVLDLIGYRGLTVGESRALPLVSQLLHLGGILFVVWIIWKVAAYTVAFVAVRLGYEPQGSSLEKHDRWKNPKQ